MSAVNRAMPSDEADRAAPPYDVAAVSAALDPAPVFSVDPIAEARRNLRTARDALDFVLVIAEDGYVATAVLRKVEMLCLQVRNVLRVVK